MLEPTDLPKLMRRRRTTRRQSSLRPAQAPVERSPEGRSNGSGSAGMETRMMPSKRPTSSSPLPAPTPQLSRALRQPGRDPALRNDNSRFNLRSLLAIPIAPANPPTENPPQRSRDRTQRFQTPRGRSRSDSMGVAPLTRPAKPSRSPIRLEPIRPSSPAGSSARASAQSRARPFSRSNHPSRQPDRVKSLKPQALPPTPPQAGRKEKRQPRRPASPLLHLTRLLILGIGVGAIAGTILSIWDPALRDSTTVFQSNSNPNGNVSTPVARRDSHLSRDLTPGSMSPLPTDLQLRREMVPLTTTVQSLTAQYPGLTPGVFLVDLDNGNYLNLNGSKIFSAASMIKAPVLVAFLQDVDAGKIRLDDMLTIQEADVAGGSGDMQYQPVGTRYSTLETAIKMITISDNTATNMLIRLMGGASVLNQRFQTWGLTNTILRTPLPDLAGANTTSPQELVNLLAMVSQGDLLSLRSRDRLFEIMQNTVTNTLLPSGLDEAAVIAHKTGNIDTVVGDTGIVDVPNGKRYIVTVIVQRAVDDARAQELIRQISRATYEYLSTPQLAHDSPDNLSSGSQSPN